MAPRRDHDGKTRPLYGHGTDSFLEQDTVDAAPVNCRCSRRSGDEDGAPRVVLGKGLEAGGDVHDVADDGVEHALQRADVFRRLPPPGAYPDAALDCCLPPRLAADIELREPLTHRERRSDREALDSGREIGAPNTTTIASPMKLLM